MRLSSIIEGIGGQPEINRTIGAAGAGLFILSTIAFEAWNMAEGRPFDVVAFCTAFPAGISAVVLAVGQAVNIKDRGVAAARATDPTVAPLSQGAPQ
ncbi:MAG TPA: hypothetical protein VGF77_08545 [Allosphingosinicella sp.]